MRRRRLPPAPRPRPGFTLVEILIAAVVMVLSTIGSAVLFNQAARQSLSGNQHLGEQLAISRDLAAILDVNERYNCTASGCGVAPDAAAPPDQDDYAPIDDEATIDAGRSFRELCSQGLLDNLVTALQNTGEIDANGILAGTSVRRTVTLLEASGTPLQSLPPHRYRVDWRAADGHGRLLRQVQLIPTIAAWCP